MTDVHEPEIRSYNMSRIRGKDTKPEMLVRRFLHSHGYRYRLHCSDLPGKPDIVFTKTKTVLFINGCFWHGHENCRYFTIPKTRTEWWRNKIVQNRTNDLKNCRDLLALGWNVITIFECELRKELQSETLNELITNLH